MKFNKKNIFILSPYIGVFTGLYLLKSAFAAIFIYHLGIIIALIGYRHLLDPKKLFKCTKKRHLIAIVISSLSGLFFYFLWDYLKIESLELSELMGDFGLYGHYKILFIIYFSTIHPLLEELYWRFILQPKAKYISIIEILFALYHIFVVRLFIKSGFVILCFVTLVIVARFWRYLHQKEENNLAIFLTHGIADLSIMAGMFLLY